MGRGFDPFGSMKNMMGQFQQFFGNPLQFMAARNLNLPQQLAGDPRGAIQHLLNSGAMTQQQYNSLQQTAQQIQSNPQFQQFMAAYGPKR